MTTTSTKQRLRDKELVTDMANISKRNVNSPGQKCLPLRYRVAEHLVKTHGRAAMAGLTWGQAKHLAR